jgi:quercetin dioxygenase-like cupin family protein
MRIFQASDFTRGWMIGDFEPSLRKTQTFEMGVLTHKKGEFWAPHYHKYATEYNLLLEGKMEINGELINEGEGFVINTLEVARPVFLEDCKVLVVKVPSVPGDKYIV